MKDDLSSSELRIALALLRCPESHLYRRDEGLTLAELGALMGLTRERVRQIERKAMGKLKIRMAKDPELFNTILQYYKDN